LQSDEVEALYNKYDELQTNINDKNSAIKAKEDEINDKK
jgi:hypothetical protein